MEPAAEELSRSGSDDPDDDLGDTEFSRDRPHGFRPDRDGGSSYDQSEDEEEPDDRVRSSPQDGESPATTRPRSPSSSSFSGATSDPTPALTPTTRERGAASSDGSSGSSEEGGSSEAPPAPVFSGIPGGGAEPAEKRNSESDTDLSRRDRERTRCTRFKDSQSEKNVKETKSKCKRIAHLLTNAPNPQNKGALLFEKRRQRVKKFTLVSYGTGDDVFDSEDRVREEEAEEIRAAAYSFVTTSDSELEEEYSLYQQTVQTSLNWERVKMEALPDTKGKGVLMFDRRRKRLDALDSEQEELTSRAPPAELLRERECPPQRTYIHEDMLVNSHQSNHIEEPQHSPKSSVPNRTAKPFLGFQVRVPVPYTPGHITPVTKRPEPRFKVRVPISSSPQVWSPTGDIIASRDERICVPAIKTGLLSESKRKAANKQALKQGAESKLQNKGDRRSDLEPEEDCFSLGAEACNFMQPRTVKLKNPPPVAPKPAIDPSCPPWMKHSSDEPYTPHRGTGSLPPHCQVGTHYLEQQESAQLLQTSKGWAPAQDQAPGWEPVSTSSQRHLEPSTNSWSQQPSRSPVSMNPPSPPKGSTPNSVASCPPQAIKSLIQSPQATYLRAQGSDREVRGASNGHSSMGKGAQLFAKRQTRMEKFVVTGDKAQSTQRAQSPTSSLPHSWRYSSNVRAPPPLSYNPLLSPFYPPSAAKQASAPSPKTKPKEKPKAPPKQLNALDIMKHQPYQLDSALFKYDAMTIAKSPSPKPTPKSKFEVTKRIKQRSAFTDSPNSSSENKSDKPAKSSKWVSSQVSSGDQSAVVDEPLVNGKHSDEEHALTPSSHHMQAPGVRPASSTSQHSSVDDSIALAFSPAALIARGARQMAPRPKFSAKKPMASTKQWKSVTMVLGRSLPFSPMRRMNSVPCLLTPPASQPSFPQRQTSYQEVYKKAPTPWEAASRSPLGSVDEAFCFQSFPSSVASSVKASGLRRSLPEPPEEWKRRVSLDPAPVAKGQYRAAPAFRAPASSRTYPPEKPAFYGPPFRPARPLQSASSYAFVRQGPQYTPLHSTFQRS